MKLVARLFFVCYCLLTSLIAPLGLWYLCHKKRRDPPYASRVWELLGFYKLSFQDCVWFHTVSVGEVIAARPLIQAFVQRHPELSIIVTTTTTTGAKEVDKISGVTHVFAPLDSPWCVKLFLRNFKPSKLFIMETELWPCMLYFTRQAGTKITVFNARMPEKTCLKYEKHRTLTRELIASRLDCVLAQTKDDAERFERIGVPRSQIKLTGSLKYDLSPNEQLFAQAFEIRKTWDNTFVIGALSTHEGEEDQILETFYNLRDYYAHSQGLHLKLILVPRHLSGVHRAQSFLDGKKASMNLRTNIDADLRDFYADVLLGNTMGEMEFYLGLCDVVFMGGSLTDVGGHNPLEPAYFSKPIITGPYYYNFAEQFELLIESSGAYVANDNRRLFNVLQMFINNKELLQNTGMHAFEVQQRGQGALKRSLDYIEECLAGDK